MNNNPKNIVSEHNRYNKISSFWVGLFIFWPFAAFVNAVKNFRHPKAKLIFWLFCVFFGFVFVYEDPYSFGKDSSVYATKLIEAHRQTISLEYLFSSFYNPQQGLIDIYEPTVTWLVAIFTDDPRFLFMIFAAVFGYFYTQNIWLILDRIESKKIFPLLFLFIVSYALINPLWNINGVRMWTAAQVFLYGILIYVLNDNKRGLIWVASSILVHFSFALPITLFFASLFLPKNLLVLYSLFLFTAFFAEVNIFDVREGLYYLPELYQERTLAYADPNRAQYFQELTYSWHVELSGLIGKWLIYLWVTYLFIIRDKWLNLFPKFKKIFAFGLILGIMANLASFIPSGSRFFVISSSLFYAVFVLLVSKNFLFNNKSIFIQLTYPMLLFIIIFKIRIGLDYMGVFTFIGNLIITPLVEFRTPLIEFIKKFI